MTAAIPDLLNTALTEDSARPFLTFYDESTTERVELSVATFANWVAKTANMLQDSLSADETTTVLIALPVHWETCVWMVAAWSVGCTVCLDPADAAADIAVVAPGGWKQVDGAEETVALSLRPMGARFTEPLPTGVIDYNAEVLGHGDHFQAYEPVRPTTPALCRGAAVQSHQELLNRAPAAIHHADATEQSRSRMLLVGDDEAGNVADALVASLAANGSLVLVRDPDAAVDEERRRELMTSERVTLTLG